MIVVCRYYLFFTNSFVYYGLTLNSGSLIPGNLHFNIIVRFSLAILPLEIFLKSRFAAGCSRLLPTSSPSLPCSSWGAGSPYVAAWQ